MATVERMFFNPLDEESAGFGRNQRIKVDREGGSYDISTVAQGNRIYPSRFKMVFSRIQIRGISILTRIQLPLVRDWISSSFSLTLCGKTSFNRVLLR